MSNCVSKRNSLKSWPSLSNVNGIYTQLYRSAFLKKIQSFSSSFSSKYPKFDNSFTGVTFITAAYKEKAFCVFFSRNTMIGHWKREAESLTGDTISSSLKHLPYLLKVAVYCAMCIAQYTATH